MKTLTAWDEYLSQNRDLLGIKPEQAECWLENAEIVPGGNKETEHGLHYLDFEYRVATVIERLPQEVGGLLILLAYQFVNTLGERDGLDWPSMSVTALDDGKFVDVEITYDARDAIYLVPVENSPIEINGQKMGFGPGGWSIAEAAQISAANANR